MLIYADPFEAYNLGALSTIYDNAESMFGGMLCREDPSNGPASQRSAEIVAGANSSNAFKLARRDWHYPYGYPDYALSGIFKPTKNPSETHWASFDFKWVETATSTPIWPASFFGFNSAYSQNSWPTRNDAPLVALSKDGLLYVGGNVSSAPAILQNTWVHVDIEIIPSTAQVNVYVNDVLAVSSPAGLPWLSGGLSCLGACISQRSITSEVVNSSDTGPWFSFFYDNLTFYDATGTSFNSRLTSAVVYEKLPLVSQVDANFANTGGAASTLAALTDYSGVMFNQSTYAKSPAADNLADTFKIDTSPIGALDTIQGISIVNLARRSAMGQRHIESRFKNGSNILDVNHSPHTSIAFSSGNLAFAEKNPDGTVWTLANLAAAEFGYVVKAS